MADHLPLLVFPEGVEGRGRCDEAFEKEEYAARDIGFPTAVFSVADHRLWPKGSSGRASGEALYRGWMLTCSEYEAFYKALWVRGVHLMTTPETYQMTHELPSTYPFLVGRTPESIWFTLAELQDRQSVEEKLRRTFAYAPLVIKDYVKSEKAYFHEAMFIGDASNGAAIWKVVDRFLELRGSFLNTGVVFRRFLPLSKESRIWWLDGRSLFPHTQSAHCAGIAKKIPSRFFTMDVATVTDPGGSHRTIVECGDGQVSGIPEGDAGTFYEHLKAAFSPPSGAPRLEEILPPALDQSLVGSTIPAAASSQQAPSIHITVGSRSDLPLPDGSPWGASWDKVGTVDDAFFIARHLFDRGFAFSLEWKPPSEVVIWID